ncbi:NAD(P)H-dependent oxidoreductase [Raoultibacter phocaeensis]|uniref:NAD(P)H-dependent oxidoreductase n=1 Tax=Raoultibacter phocaeensis TaxID=2479841 RepID=UPI001119E05E|nr:NAD(P)H-dependent oxidoreductase [Raoultibacter phocaeensis]
MPQTLFVNACMRKELSRTLTLARAYLADKENVFEVDLATLGLLPLDGETAARRADLQKAGAWDDPIFDLAKQFASADEIVIGAPYWDLSFPAALKVYIEHASVCDIAFHYTEQGQAEGICKATSLTYITSCGGFVEGANYGYEYLCGIAKMFGIPETRFVAAEGLDVVGLDVEAQMQKALDTIAKLNGR